MDYELEKKPAACVLRFEGDLSGQAEVELKRLFVRMRQEGDVRIAADMRKVSFMDSSVLGTLVWALKNFREAGGDLRLFGLHDFVQRLFDITGLNRPFACTARRARRSRALATPEPSGAGPSGGPGPRQSDRLSGAGAGNGLPL